MISCMLCCFLALSLSNSAPEQKLSMDMVKATLLNGEARRKDMSGSNHFEANVVLDSNRRRAKNKDSSHNRDKFMERSKSKSTGNIICYYYNNPGHIQKFCRKKKRDKSQQRKEKNETTTSGQQKQSNEKGTLALAISSDDVCFIGEQGSLNLACDDCI